MIPYIASLTFTCCVVFGVAAFSFAFAPRTRTAVLLSVFNLVVGSWVLFQLMGEVASSYQEVLFWTKANLASAVLIPPLFYTFVKAFTGDTHPKRSRVYLAIACALLLLGSLKGGLFISGLSKTSFFKYYPIAGPVYYMFAAYFAAFVTAGFARLAVFYRNSSGARRNQAAYILAASAVGFVSGSTQFFPAFGLDVFPAGMFIFPLYALLAAYAVVSRRLFDLKIAIRKSLVYSLIVVIFSLICALMLLICVGLLENLAGFNYFVSASFSVAVFVLLFDPLRSSIQKTVDKAFFRDSYAAREVLKAFSKSRVLSMNAEELKRLAVKEISCTWKVKDLFLAKKEKNGDQFTITLKHGFEGIQETFCLSSSLFFGKDIYVEKEQSGSPLPAEVLKAGAALLFFIKAGDKVSGLLAVGEKPGHGLWGKEDLEIFETVCALIGAAEERDRLYEKELKASQKILESEKFAAIGALAASAAHEIKNPLTSLKGMISVLPQNLGDTGFLKTFNEISIRQLDRINSAVNNLLSISRGDQDPLCGMAATEESPAEELISEVCLPLYEDCKKKTIEIKVDIKDRGLKLKGRKKELSGAFSNIIMNSIEAMQQGGELRISLSGSQVIIEDTGEGMDRQTLDRIFEPFFTTKKGGAGIGLYAAAKAINCAGGRIEVTSALGKGAKFVIDFSG